MTDSIDLYIVNYNTHFTRIPLLFSFIGNEIDTVEKTEFIKHIFNDMYTKMLTNYTNLKNDDTLLNHFVINALKEYNKSLHYDLDELISCYFQDYHPRYSVCELSKNEMHELISIYKPYLYSNITQLSRLIEQLYNQCINKIDLVDDKHYDSFVNFYMEGSHCKNLLLSITVHRDYMLDKNKISKYIMIDGTSENKYYKIFTKWYNNIANITNNFNEHTIDEYFNNTFNNDIDSIKNIFTIPYCDNNIAINYMIEHYQLRNINQYYSEIKLPHINLKIRSYLFKSSNLPHNFNCNEDRCIIIMRDEIRG